MNSALVVYRDFGDGSEEIGVLTCENGIFWVHVGDFTYCLTLSGYSFSDFPFIILGVL